MTQRTFDCGCQYTKTFWRGKKWNLCEKHASSRGEIDHMHSDTYLPYFLMYMAMSSSHQSGIAAAHAVPSSADSGQPLHRHTHDTPTPICDTPAPAPSSYDSSPSPSYDSSSSSYSGSYDSGSSGGGSFSGGDGSSM